MVKVTIWFSQWLIDCIYTRYLNFFKQAYYQSMLLSVNMCYDTNILYIIQLEESLNFIGAYNKRLTQILSHN